MRYHYTNAVNDIDQLQMSEEHVMNIVLPAWGLNLDERFFPSTGNLKAMYAGMLAYKSFMDLKQDPVEMMRLFEMAIRLREHKAEQILKDNPPQ